VNNLRKEIVNNPYAWPGGYPKYAITDDGGCLCWKCCQTQSAEIDNAFPGSGWNVIELDINWESLLYCDHCGSQIESAYEIMED
jgi:hypothetical protein